MAIQNPRFEVGGYFPGEAEGWTLNSQASLREFAGFGGEPEIAWERFDQWLEYLGALETPGIVTAFFDNGPEGYEDFEENWKNDLYLWELPDGHVEGLGIEKLETGWHNAPYCQRLNETNSEIALFEIHDWDNFVFNGYSDLLEQVENEKVLFDEDSEFEVFNKLLWLTAAETEKQEVES